MTSNQPAAPRPAGRAVFHLLLTWVLLPLCLFSLAGVASLYLLCRFKPDLVISSAQYHLSAATGMPWRIRGSITPALAPYPGVRIADVRLLAISPELGFHANSDRPLLQVKTLYLYLDPLALLTFSVRFQRIELEEPVINLAYDTQKRPLWIAPPPPADAPPPDSPVAEKAAATPSDETAPPDDPLKFAADMICALPSAAAQPVTIRGGSLMSYDAQGKLLLSFTGLDGSFAPGAEGDNLRLSTSFALPAAGLELFAQLSARVGCEGIPARGAISGAVHMTPPGSRTLTGNFASSFTWLADGRNVLLPDFRIAAESDALTAALCLDLAVPECTGKVQIHKLSLPRWFGFGRVLPPGLRQTLDALIGEFDLQFDMDRAEARNLRGVVGPLAVSGFVGTPDFSKPVVVVDLDVDRANLDLIFPFLAAVGRFVPDPTPPRFDHPPLAPYPENPNAPPPPPDAGPPIDVSYDVTVRVARPRVHDVDGGPLKVTVLPALVKGVEKTRVAFSVPSIIEGRVDGTLDIDEHSILMRYNAKGLELRLLPENAENIVRIAGKVTGICEIDVPMLPNGDLADVWPIRVNAGIRNCDITAHYPNAPWSLFSGKLDAAGAGTIYAVRSKGIRIDGLWDLGIKDIRTSWHPKGKDAITATFSGGLHWPPIADAPPLTARKLRLMEKRGVDKVVGAVTAEGSLMVPLGAFLAPVTGKLTTDLDWRLYGQTITVSRAKFTGFGSYSESDVNIDFSGDQVRISSDMSFTINPGSLLKGWGIALPDSMIPPKLLSGKMAAAGKKGSLRFEKIKVEMDGAPISGEISWEESDDARSGDSGNWTFRLAARHFDLDTLFPPDPPVPPGRMPPPPSRKPWDLSALKGLGIDAQVTLHNVKKDKLSFAKTKVTGALQRDRFSLHTEIADFYGGTGVLLFQGTVVPEKSLVTLRKGLLQMQQVAMGRLLHDYTGERSYAGLTDLVADITGHLTCDADIPARLSGVWNLTIKDGLYPAFIGSDSSNLRNTFSSASIGGVLDKGVLRSDNFTLTGPMVDMSGGGWLNLNNTTYDFGLSATFAKVPTVPVRFYGSMASPHMQIRGADMVVETVQAAGMTVFGLIRGILELPAHAVRGISSLFDTGDHPVSAPHKPAPVKHQTGHPGQSGKQ